MKHHFGQHMPEMKEGGVNVTPLIDVVMCLIVFFMLVARIGVLSGIDARVRLPSAEGGQHYPSAAGTVTLNVRSDGKGPAITSMAGGAMTELPLDALAAHLGRQHCERVVIRGDRHLPYGYVQRVLRECGQAGVAQISLSIRAEEKRP